MNRLLVGLMLAGAMALPAAAQLGQAEITLRIGDRAPKLEQGKYIQGEPVSGFESGKVYVVEFWATWCGPCRMTIPHLNKLHEKFKDKGLIVIGQDVWERGDDVAGAVEKFVKKMGADMTYRVALDKVAGEGDRGRMATTWMAAAGRNGIPSAFLVNQSGVVVWIGHPAIGLDEAVEAVLAGTFDIEKAKKELEEQERKNAELRKERTEKASKIKPFNDRIKEAVEAKEWDKAFIAIDDLEKAVPLGTNDMMFGGYDYIRFNIALQKKDGALVTKFAGRLLESVRPPPMLNLIAWKMLVDPGIEPRDPALAAKIATKAIAGLKEEDPNLYAVLDTLARARFMNGEKEAAIESQTKAIELCKNEKLKPAYQKTLDAYKKGELPPPDEPAGGAR